MAVIFDLAVQGAQMLLVLLVAPALTGLVRKVKAHVLRRQGPPIVQPYLDLARLMRKASLVGVTRRRCCVTTQRDEDARPAPDLVDRQRVPA